jgi:hypothetical protein
MTRGAKRTLGIPDAYSREWRLPAILYWLLRRRSTLLADQGDIYADNHAWKRRIMSIDRRIAKVERELLAVDQATPFAWLTPEKSSAGADNDQYRNAA